MWNRGDGNGSTVKYKYGSKQLSEGYSTRFFYGLESLDGIKSYTLSTVDNCHLFEWDNMDNDPYIKAVRDEVIASGSYYDKERNYLEYVEKWGDVLKENSLEFGYTSCFVKDTRKTYEEYQKKWGTESMDYDSFASGEQVFVIMPDVGSFIKEGTTLYIVSGFAGRQLIPVKVAAVIPLDETKEVGAIGSSGRISHTVKIIASENLGRRIAEIDGNTFMYNSIEIYLKSSAKYNLTAKQCANLLTAENSKYVAMYEKRGQILNENLGKIIMYATFMILAMAFFIIIRINIIQSGFTFQGNQIRRLRLLGMEKRKVRRMYIAQGLYESRWLWITAPVVYLYKAYLLYDEYRYNGQLTTTRYFYIEEIKQHVMDAESIVKYTLNRYVNISMLIAIVVIMVLINVLTRYFVVKSYLKELDKENFC